MCPVNYRWLTEAANMLTSQFYPWMTQLSPELQMLCGKMKRNMKTVANFEDLHSEIAGGFHRPGFQISRDSRPCYAKAFRIFNEKVGTYLRYWGKLCGAENTHTHAFTHTHSHTHTFTHTHIHTHTFPGHIHTNTFTQTYIHTYSHTYICTNINIHTYIHTHTHIHIYIHTYTQIYTYIHTHIHIHTYIHT